MALYEEQFAFKSKKTTPRNTILHSFITLILRQTTKQNQRSAAQSDKKN